MIIAVDFDDTLFKYAPPSDGSRDYSGRPDSIGEPIWKWINWAKEKKAQGHKLILWTCREGAALDLAIQAAEDVGLLFDAVNANIRGEDEYLHWPDCRKVKADIYLDDRGLTATVEDV